MMAPLMRPSKCRKPSQARTPVLVSLKRANVVGGHRPAALQNEDTEGFLGLHCRYPSYLTARLAEYLAMLRAVECMRALPRRQHGHRSPWRRDCVSGTLSFALDGAASDQPERGDVVPLGRMKLGLPRPRRADREHCKLSSSAAARMRTCVIVMPSNPISAVVRYRRRTDQSYNGAGSRCLCRSANSSSVSRTS